MVEARRVGGWGPPNQDSHSVTHSQLQAEQLGRSLHRLGAAPYTLRPTPAGELGPAGSGVTQRTQAGRL